MIKLLNIGGSEAEYAYACDNLAELTCHIAKIVSEPHIAEIIKNKKNDKYDTVYDLVCAISEHAGSIIKYCRPEVDEVIAGLNLESVEAYRAKATPLSTIKAIKTLSKDEDIAALFT